MKHLIILLFLVPVFAYSQTRIRDLSTQATYDGSLYVPCDKAGFAQTKKIALSVLTGAEATLRKSQDTLTRRAVGISDSGYYLTDEGTNYLTSALMAGYDTNSVMTAIHMLDSILYKTNTSVALWDTGSVSTSVLRDNNSNSAVGAYSMAINNTNHSDGKYSLAKGTRAVAIREMSTAIASGKIDDVGDAQSMEYVLKGITIGTTNDTLMISTVYPTLQTDQFSKFHIELICSIDTGTAGLKIGCGMTQHWDFSAWNDAGTSALVGTADSSTAKRTQLTFDGTVSVVIHDPTESVYVIVHGMTGYRIKWVAYVRETMVGFRNFTTGH